MAEKDSDSLTEERKQEEQECIPNLFTFFKLCSKLKHLKRTGWVNHNVKEPETVAGHMYRMSLMSFLFSKDNSIDYNKCVKMSLVHDLAESIVGDLTPSCNVSKEEKHQREKDAMVKISELVPKEVGQELYSLWTDYEECLSPEAVLVHDLDKFDMIFQAYEYETDQGRKGELQQFFDSTKDIFKSSTVQLWTAQLLKIRQESETIEKEK
ncbi:PREDICTED: HD domain-containing protein 2 homolog isoform X2 [Amphimedon queenslandica]|uniref:5'-deoxynucleotidase HDDC2 n=1 Tax=Amphimedon queenslandica TaxID=400682 RepID=A0AAN0IN46_AMPQE|nr:PREDICTED: HD domain-containing protein 2 homolog isoform X2 [Amphimedon queenslandica]|eukprot:XP_011404693.2 PREDICTED: HD domain-containing protein 2 homolog isoform X2 [Amphimedon queenslandica]